MTKSLIVIAILLIFQISLSAQSLSPNAKISLVTIGPGEELYSTFGHTAIWVFDPQNHLNVAYNYGTFEFTPDFYMKFTRGKLDYRLSVSSFDELALGAEYEQRYVVAQELNLTDQQKDALYKFLENNLLPENRYYRYDFFFDNCSSRVRDVLKKICGDALHFNLKPEKPESFRQLIDHYLTDKKWQDLGMDIGLGAPSDRKATAYDYMFLPEHLMQHFDNATLERDGKNVPLVSETRKLYEPQKIDKDNTWLTPSLLFWLLFVIILLVTLFNFKRKPSTFIFDSILYIFTGLLGFLIVFLWFFTDHNVTINNWNILWAFPLNFFVAFFIRKNKKNPALAKYFLGFAIVCALLAIFNQLIPQELNKATIPLILILAVRSVNLYYKLNIPKEAI